MGHNRSHAGTRRRIAVRPPGRSGERAGVAKDRGSPVILEYHGTLRRPSEAGDLACRGIAPSAAGESGGDHLGAVWKLEEVLGDLAAHDGLLEHSLDRVARLRAVDEVDVLGPDHVLDPFPWLDVVPAARPNRASVPGREDHLPVTGLGHGGGQQVGFA